MLANWLSKEKKRGRISIVGIKYISLLNSRKSGANFYLQEAGRSRSCNKSCPFTTTILLNLWSNNWPSSFLATCCSCRCCCCCRLFWVCIWRREFTLAALSVSQSKRGELRSHTIEMNCEIGITMHSLIFQVQSQLHHVVSMLFEWNLDREN